MLTPGALKMKKQLMGTCVALSLLATLLVSACTTTTTTMPTTSAAAGERAPIMVGTGGGKGG